MSITPTMGLGPYFNNNGEVNVAGVLQFLDPDTTSPKTVYTDRDLTIPADNPITLDGEGRTLYQVFYGAGDYLVRLYELIDLDIVSPVFPDDYTVVSQWIDKGNEDAVVDTITTTEVDTINDLTLVDTTKYDIVNVIGYFNRDDNIDTRVYKWNPLSVASPDGGSVISASGVGTGRWELKVPSDVVDVRWFGAIPNSGVDCNSGIEAASAFAISNSLIKPLTVYFPQGTYQVIPGVISTVSTVKIDEKSDFFNRLSGQFIIDCLSRYEINKVSKFKAASSVGEAILDISNSEYGAEFDYAVSNLVWEDANEAFTYSGKNPILFDSTATVNLNTINHNDKVVKFRKIGSLSLLGNNTLNIARVDCDDKYQQRFTYSYTGTTILSFDKMNLYSSWFGSTDALKFASKTDCKLILNSDIVTAPSYSLDLSSLALIKAEEGSINVNNGVTLTLPERVIGKLIGFNGDDDTCTINTNSHLNSYNFNIGSTHALRQFVRISNNEYSQAAFNGESYNFLADLQGFNTEIANVRLTNGVTLGSGNVVKFKDCVLNGTFVGATSTLSLDGTSSAFASVTCENLISKNSVITNPVVATTVNIRYSTINNNITCGKTEILYSTIGEYTITPVPYSTMWDFTISDNIFKGGYILPNGNGFSTRCLIERNDFRFPESQDINTFLYVPITDSNWVVSHEPYLYGTIPFYTGSSIAYNVRVADNTPFNTDALLPAPTSGTLLKQTKVRFSQFNEGLSSTLGVKNAPGTTTDDRILTPAMVDKLVYSYATVSSFTKVATGTEAAKISLNGYITESATPGTFNLLIENDGSVDEVGSSVELDLYPFRLV